MSIFYVVSAHNRFSMQGHCHTGVCVTHQRPSTMIVMDTSNRYHALQYSKARTFVCLQPSATTRHPNTLFVDGLIKIPSRNLASRMIDLGLAAWSTHCCLPAFIKVRIAAYMPSMIEPSTNSAGHDTLIAMDMRHTAFSPWGSVDLENMTYPYRNHHLMVTRDGDNGILRYVRSFKLYPPPSQPRDIVCSICVAEGNVASEVPVGEDYFYRGETDAQSGNGQRILCRGGVAIRRDVRASRT
jgi:hypothetical protein